MLGSLRNQKFFVNDINGVSGVVSPVSMFTNKSGIAQLWPQSKQSNTLFLQSYELGLPSPCGSGGEGVGKSQFWQFRRWDRHCGTQGIYVLRGYGLTHRKILYYT